MERADRLRTLVDEALSRRTEYARVEQQRQDRRIAQFERERERDKLLQLHYADALPLERVTAEQRRITRQMDEAIASRDAARVESGKIAANLDKVLNDLRDPQAAYRGFGPVARKHSNVAFFERIAVDTAGITDARLNDTYATILAP